jgi:hypothetical protein
LTKSAGDGSNDRGCRGQIVAIVLIVSHSNVVAGYICRTSLDIQLKNVVVVVVVVVAVVVVVVVVFDT